MKHLILLPLAVFLLASCGSTVTSRIEENPVKYDRLNQRHKALVERGQIERGMNKDAVFLAWGKPASVAGGEGSKGRFERWTYTRLDPVYTHSFHGGYGYSRYGRRGYYGNGRCRGGYGYRSGYGANVHYVPRKSASVEFRNERVTDWQRGRYGSGSPLYH